MEINIFDVEHGACALLTAPSLARMLIDCGHNNNTGWRPSICLPENDITYLELFVVTNYDEDHVSDLVNLRRTVNIKSLLRNKSVSPNDIRKLKSEDGMGAGIDEFCQMATTYNQPPDPVNWGGVERKSFHNQYPGDFDDENNLSLVSFISYGGLKIVFPGDLEKAGWDKLLEQEAFRQELAGVNVFVASHHGRQSGCCEEVFKYCHPNIVIFSDKSKGFQTQETVGWYASRCKGISYRGSTRKVFTTRHDGNIKLTTNGFGFDIATDKGLASDPVAEALGAFLTGGVLGMGLAALRMPRL